MLHAHQHPQGAVQGVDTNSGSSLQPGAEEGQALSQALLRGSSSSLVNNPSLEDVRGHCALQPEQNTSYPAALSQAGSNTRSDRTMPEQVHELGTLTLTGVQTDQQQQQQALVFYSAATVSSRETSSSKSSSSSSNCERLSRHACEQGHPLPSLAGANIDGMSQLQHHQQLLKAAADSLQHTGTLHNPSHDRSSSSGSDEAGPGPGAAFPREIAPSFSGWSTASAAAAAAGMQQHPSAKSCPGPSSTGGSQLQPLPAVLFSQAMHHPAAGCGFYSGMQAAGTPKTRARRKSASDDGAHSLPSPIISRRRKSTGSQHCGLFGALSAGCSFLSGAEGSSSRSGSLDSPAECLVSVTTAHSSPMEDVHSMGRPSQHHLGGCLLSIAEVDVPAPASPGRDNLYAHQQQQQQGLQQGTEQYGEQYSKPPCDAGAGLLPVAVARRSPTPPGDSSAICVSPRVSTLYQQYHSQGGNSNSSRRAATEPPAINHNSSVSSSGSCTRGSVPSGRSPGAAAMVMSNKSTGGYQLPPPPQQQQHQVLQQVLPRAQQDSTAAAAAAAARAPPPVARDITQRLQSQGPASKGTGAQASSGAAPDLQHSSSLWHTWALHLDSRGPNSQQQQQQTPSSSTAGSRPDSACSFDQYPRAQQQLPPPGPVGSGGRALLHPQRSSAGSIGPCGSVAKSPAPPPVPPSPQQLHAAELRVRRSSCSSIPAMPSGVLSPGPLQPGDHWSHLSLMGRGTSSTGHMTHAVGDASSSAAESGVTLLQMPPAVCDSVWSDLSAAPPSPGRAGLPQGSRRSPVRDQSGMQDVGRNHPQLQLHRHHTQAPGAAAGADASNGSIREALDKLQGLPGSMHSTHGQQPNAAEHSGASSEQEQAAQDMARAHCQQHWQHQQQQQMGLKVASLSSAGHLNGSHRGSASAALPPLHPPAHQQHSDAPATPRGHVMLNPQLAPRSASAVLGSGTGLQPLHHPQQPVPPRQHAPPCRSPCVSARLHASALSPAAAAFMGGGGAFTSSHMVCSPILEQVPSTSSNPSSNGSIRLGTDGRSSPAAGHAGGSHHSSYNSGAVHGHSAASSNGSTTPTTDTSSGSGRQLLGAHSPILPKPAFVQLARGGSCDSVFYQHHRQAVAVRSPSPPCALDTSAAVQGYSRPMRAVSPSIRKADLTVPGVHTSSSGSSSSSSTACQQQLQVPRVVLSPSPPPDRPMGAAAMTASPRVHSLGGVQPCPPAHSQPPPSPSPSLRARLLTPHSSQTSGGLHGAAGHSMAQHAAAAGAAATGHAGQLQHSDSGEAAAASVSAWAGSSPCVVGRPAPRGRLMLGGHDAAAEGLAAAGQDRQHTQVAPQAFSRPPALLQPASADADAADSGNTPDLSWMHATADGDPADRPSAPHAAATAGTSVRYGASAKSAAAAEDSSAPQALEWPVVVAFGHYRGRLGYLMNSGVVGVLFEDASHMLMREGSRTACYIDSAVRSVSADPAAPVVGAHSSSSSSSTRPSEAGGAKAPVSAVQVGKAKAKSQLPHSSSSSSSNIAAGVSSISRSNSTDTCHSDQTPAAYHSTPGAGAAATVPAQAGSAAACSQSRGADGLALKLPPPPCRDDGGSKDVSGDGDSSSGGVPEHLAAKVRCLQRFAGCLLHHTPYSSKRHVDITRLALPGAWGLQHSQAQQQGAVLLMASAVHIQHFSYSEGCVLLTLTNGAQQLVFTSDNSVMLLQSHGQQLVFITPPRPLKTPGAGSSSSSGSDSDRSSTSDTCRDAARRGEAAGVVLLQLSAHTPLPDDTRLQARLRQARCLPGVMQLPFSMGGI